MAANTKSLYYTQLVDSVKVRYSEKISIINDLDPYTLKNADFEEHVVIPEVTLIDLVNYLVLTHSYYTGQQLKAFKSLQAFKYFEAGFVQKLNVKKINDVFVVVGTVKHSQRMSANNLGVWVIILHDGSVSSAHCTCMAGLGEVCSHVAAVLFALHFKKKSEDLSCTDQLALWPVPSGSNIQPVMVKDIAWGRISTRQDDRSAPSLQGDELNSFLTKIQETGAVPAICRVIEPFASQMVATETFENMPVDLRF